MRPDRYGLPLSIDSSAARDAYVAGADCILMATAGWKEQLQKAIEAEPGFALAHIALARGHRCRWERGARGSRAQRDLVDYMLLAAYLKAARTEDARRLIARREARRPTVSVAGFS